MAGDGLIEVQQPTPALPVGSSQELFGVAHSLGINLNLAQFSYNINQPLSVEVISNIRAVNQAEELGNSAGGILKQHGIEPQQIYLPNSTITILGTYKKGKITEEECLAFLAERELLRCNVPISFVGRLNTQFPDSKPDWVSAKISEYQEMLNFFYTKYQVYVQLAQKFKQKPELQDQIREGLLLELREAEAEAEKVA